MVYLFNKFYTPFYFLSEIINLFKVLFPSTRAITSLFTSISVITLSVVLASQLYLLEIHNPVG